jgi:uncharacterized protein (DUF983 family)
MTDRPPATIDPGQVRDLPPGGWARLGTLLHRALTRRCPQCGSSGIFRGYWTLRDRCPRCDYRFDREEGYFLGAYAINLIVAEFLSIAVLVDLLVRTDLSWVAIEAIVIPLAIGLPILFFPFSRTLWMALDLMIDRNSTDRQLRHEELRRGP